MSRATGAAGTLAGAVGRVGRGALAGARLLGTFGAAIGAAFGLYAVRAAINFQEQLAIINTIAGLTETQTVQLGKDLRAIAVDRGLRLNDLTQSYYDFLSAGITLGDSFDALHDKAKVLAIQNVILKNTADLAIGGLATQAEATKLMAFALNTFQLNDVQIQKSVSQQAGLTARDVGTASQQIADYFAKAVEIGVVTAPQIATSFATVALTAKNAGIGVDEISAAYAVLTQRGFSASRVTVSMNRAILELIKPGKQLSDLMARTGVNYQKIAQTQGIQAAFQRLRNDAQHLGINFVDLFKRQEAYRFALAITSDTTDKADKTAEHWNETLQQVRNSVKETNPLIRDMNGNLVVGTAAIQAFIRGDTLSRNLIKLQEAFRSLGITIGYWFLIPLNNVVKGITRVIHSFDLWLQSLSPAQVKIAQQAAALAGLVAAIIGLSGSLQAFLIIGARFAPMLGLTATNVYGLQRAIGFLLLPIGLLAAVFGGFTLLVRNNIAGFGQFRHELDDMFTVGQRVGAVFTTFADGLRLIWTTLSQGHDASRAAEVAFSNLGKAVQNIEAPLARVGRFVGRVLVTVGSAIVSGLSRAAPAILRWAGSVVETLAGAFVRFVAVVGTAISRAAPGVLAALGRFLREVVANIEKWVATTGPRIVDMVGILGRGLVSWVLDAAPRVLAALGDLLSTVLGWVARAVPVIVRAVGEWATAFATWVITDALPALLNSLSDMLSRFAAWISSSQVIRRITNAVLTWVGGFVTALALVFGQVANWLVNNADTIINAIIDVAAQIVAGFVDFLTANAPRIAAAAVYIAATFVASLAGAIINDPTVLVKAIVALFAIQTLNLAIGAVIAAGKAIGVRFGLAVAAGAAASGGGAAAAQAIAAGTAAGAATATKGGIGTRLAAALAGLISSAWATAAKLPIVSSVIAAVADIGATIYLKALYAKQDLGKVLSGLWTAAQPAVVKAAQAVGGAALAAMRALAAVNPILIPVTIVAVAAAAAGAIDDAQEKSKLASLRDEIANSLNSGTDDALKAVRQHLDEAIAQAKVFGKGQDYIDALLSLQSDFNTRAAAAAGQSTGSAYADAALSAAQQEAGRAFGGNLNIDVNDPFGINRLLNNAQSALDKPLDYSPLGQGAASAGEQTGQKYGDAVQKGINDTLAINAQSLRDRLNALTKPPTKPGGKPTLDLKSDEQRAKELRGIRRQAEADLAAARKAHDSVTATALLALIDDTNTQLTALTNASTTLDAATAANAKAAAALKAMQANMAGINTKSHQHGKDDIGSISAPTVVPAPKVQSINPEDVHRNIVQPITNAANTNRRTVSSLANYMSTAAKDAATKYGTGFKQNSGQATNPVATTIGAIIKAVTGHNFFGYGANLIQTLLNGMISKIPKVDIVRDIISNHIADAFRGKSPPKYGPLRFIDRWGANLVTTLADAMVDMAPYARQAGFTVAGAAATGLNSTYAGTQTIAPIAPTASGSRSSTWAADSVQMLGRDQRTHELLEQTVAALHTNNSLTSRLVKQRPDANGALEAQSVVSQVRMLTGGRI